MGTIVINLKCDGCGEEIKPKEPSTFILGEKTAEWEQGYRIYCPRCLKR